MTRVANDAGVTERLWDSLETELAPAGRPAALKVLFATDGSAEADKALHLLQTLAFTAGSSIHVLTVTAGAEWTMPEWFVAGEHSWGNSISTKVSEALRQPGVHVVGTARSGSAAYEVIEAAEEYQADLVVVGSKGLTGLAGFLLGSVARNVAKHARRPVLVARDLRHDLQRVVLAVDSSTHAAQAARLAARLPLPADAIIQVVQVVYTHQPYAVVAPEFQVEYDAAMNEAEKQEKAAAETLTRSIADRLIASGKRAEPLVLRGDPADEILKLVQRNETDLVIVGARGVSLIEGLLVGSVADRLLKCAPCSVLLVR
jgi:nucleotide-binding universal stress UspA family protein